MNYNETSQWAADLGSGYSSIRPLGEGGMGTLYRAHKDSLDVDVDRPDSAGRLFWRG